MILNGGSLLINETLEVRDYLEGKNINKKNAYRMIYLIAKYKKEQGYAHAEVRSFLKEWMGKNKINDVYNLNTIINNAFSDKKPITSDIIVKINQKDIDEITNRFDKRAVRIIALALLCYSKVFSDSSGEITISIRDLSNWVDVNYTYAIKSCIPELINFGYLEKIEYPAFYHWNGVRRANQSHFSLNVPVKNEGEYELTDNNIQEFYQRLFVR